MRFPLAPARTSARGRRRNGRRGLRIFAGPRSSCPGCAAAPTFRHHAGRSCEVSLQRARELLRQRASFGDAATVIGGTPRERPHQPATLNTAARACARAAGRPDGVCSLEGSNVLLSDASWRPDPVADSARMRWEVFLLRDARFQADQVRAGQPLPSSLGGWYACRKSVNRTSWISPAVAAARLQDFKSMRISALGALSDQAALSRWTSKSPGGAPPRTADKLPRRSHNAQAGSYTSRACRSCQPPLITSGTARKPCNMNVVHCPASCRTRPSSVPQPPAGPPSSTHGRSWPANRASTQHLAARPNTSCHPPPFAYPVLRPGASPLPSSAPRVPRDDFELYEHIRVRAREALLSADFSPASSPPSLGVFRAYSATDAAPLAWGKSDPRTLLSHPSLRGSRAGRVCPAFRSRAAPRENKIVKPRWSRSRHWTIPCAT